MIYLNEQSGGYVQIHIIYIFIYEHLLKVDLNVEEWIKNISATMRIIPHKARYHDLKQRIKHVQLITQNIAIFYKQKTTLSVLLLYFQKKKQKTKLCMMETVNCQKRCGSFLSLHYCSVDFAVLLTPLDSPFHY